MSTPSQFLQQKLGGINKSPPASPSDYLKNLSTQPDYSQFEGTNDTHENDTSFGHTLGSFVKYLGSLATNPNVSIPTNTTELAQKIGPALPEVYNNIKNDLTGAIQYYKNTPFQQIAFDTKGFATSSAPSNLSPGSIAGGLLSGFVQKPIEAVTATVNDNGTARPATPQEEALSLQSSAALVAQLSTFKALKSSFLGAAPETADAATAALQPTTLGKLTLSGGFKQGAKYIAAETGAGALSGGVQGAISGIGQDDQAEQIIGGALTFAPLTAALATFGVSGYVKGIRMTKVLGQALDSDPAIRNIAAVNALRVNPSDPYSTLINNVSAAASSDDLVKAAIRSRLDVGDGYIVEGVSKQTGEQIASGAVPSSKAKPTNYTPPPELNKPRPRPNSTEVKFDDPFDKLAYLAAARKPSAFVESLVDDAVNQTGLSKDEIISHGKYVRSQQLQQYRTGKLIPRTQAEIDAYNQASLQAGQKIAAGMPEGGKYTDANGTVWTRTGNSVSNPDGSQVLPIDQTNTLQILGRKKSDTPFYQPFQQLPAQEFNPNFSRFDVNKGMDKPVYYHYSDNGNLLVTPTKYTPDAIQFFKTSGFMRGEIVGLQGADHIVTGFNNGVLQLKDATSGRTVESQPAFVRRTNNSLTPEIVDNSSNSALNNIANGVNVARNLREEAKTQMAKPIGVRAPVLNQESLLNTLYTKFYNAYKAAPEDQPFSAFAQKFYSSVGIKEADYNHVSTIFTKKLADDLAKTTLSPEEQAARSSLMAQFEGLRDKQINDLSYHMSVQAESNGMFYSPEGGGKYRLRDQETGKTLALVGTPDEALAAINKIRQASGKDLDGGYSGPVPPGVANINPGGLAEDYTPRYNKVSQWFDLARATGKVFPKITPIGKVFQSVDNLSGGKTQFFPTFLKLQNALMNRTNIIERDPTLKVEAAKLQSLLDQGAKFTANRRTVLADNLDAMSIDDIKTRYLPRPMNTFEDTIAQEVAKTDVGAVQDLMYKTKMAGRNIAVGSSAYIASLREIAAKTNVDPEVANKAMLLARLISVSPLDGFSGDAVLRLAHAYEAPHLAISQAEHARVNKITPDETAYINDTRDAFKRLAKVAGIDEKAQLQMYLPALVRRVASGGTGPIPEDFAREMTRAGITPKNIQIRDPNQLINKYFVSVINQKSGFNAALNEFSDAVGDQVQALKGTDLESAIPQLGDKFTKYVNEVSGHKTIEDNLSEVGKQIATKLGFKTIEPNSVLNLMALGSIAGRPMLAVRDYHNIAGMSYVSMGHEFTGLFLTKSVNPEYVQELKKNNILPQTQVRSIIDPAADESALISSRGIVSQWASKAFNISGQEFAYEHANAGIYKASMSMAEKYFELLRKKEITKEQAYDKMGISSNYGPGLIKQIDGYLQKGDTPAAADLYAQANMRFLSHVYGFHNNPEGWNSNFGRLLSQWGSWNANASQSTIDQFTRGTKMQIAAKALRMGTFNAATLAAGSALGWNLKSWTVSNPMNMWPTTGPLIGLTGTMADDWDQSKMSYKVLRNEMLGFVPYGRAAMGWARGLDQIGQGRLLTGLGVMAGAPLGR